VGQTTVDLSGPRTSDVTARIEAGIGELTVRVPSGIGVRVTTISEGVGDFSFEGFTKDGDDYVNDAYASSDVKMEITLHQGIGEITFESVP
jgi:bacillopeptidase F (M6 metalloprotease family)